MSDPARLTRREREIMDVVFARQRATVQEICGDLSDPPTPMAVRRMLAILLEKGMLKRHKQGREYVYLPRQSKQRAGLAALRQVLKTFFDGSVEAALATYFEKPGAELSDEELERLSQLIDELSAESQAQARSSGRRKRQKRRDS
jgi:BlaI family transcriptional regulator, penicillinase repressor